MKSGIQPDQNVADLLSNWPAVIPLFLAHHMSCVGCSMARFETLADVTRIYGIGLSLFLSEINEQVNPQPFEKEGK